MRTHTDDAFLFSVLSDVNPNLCRSVQAALALAFLQAFLLT